MKLLQTRFSLLTFFIIYLQTIVFPQDLPPIKISYASYAVTQNGKLLGYFGEKNRVDIKSTGYISKWIIYSLIATEDRDFYNHDGVSYKGLGRAVLKTLTGSTQGGSTLTMQLARNLFLSFEKSISRKLREIELAKALERKFSKDEILLLYLNTVYFGHSSWGIWAAAQEYFGKTPDKLSITEAATIVGLLQSPGAYDPARNPEKTLARRNEVLYNLVEVGKLSNGDFNKYKKQPLSIKLHENLGRHFLEQVRREATAILNQRGIYLNRDQIKITTTLNYDMQKAAEDAVKIQWNSFPGSMKEAQVGLVSVEPGTGMIRVLVGGNPGSEARGLNRAIQIHRQPGSSFKPFLYGSLLEKGFTLATPTYDTPISVVDTITNQVWTPQNSSEVFTNDTIPMISAIQYSVNAAAAHAIVELTKPDSVVAFAKKVGIESYIPPYPSIALGTGEVTPLEMAASFAVFASEGKYAKPFSILKIEDKNGRLLYSANVDTVTVLDSATCYLLTTAMQAVVDSGTAASVRRYYKGTAAGKTGTTQDYTDAWFVGYNSQLSTAIWTGYDNAKRKLNGGFQYGGSAAAPIWGRMMSDISRKVTGFYGTEFTRPTSIQDIELCIDSGEPATINCPNKKYFPVDFLKLKGSCHIHLQGN
ncbi:MAG: transglycosylase domain-containing protein [Ignavibacteriales bacterium]|nr:transglycosylase domain-containing protein [Ignavibacteriales bacterium]